MSKWCFHPTPLQLPPPTISLSFLSSSKQKKALGSSIGHTSMYSIYKLNLWLSDSHIGQLCVIIQHHMPLKANIYCICLLDIEWLWCLSPALQSRASPLCLPEIYSAIDFFPPSPSVATFKTQGNITSYGNRGHRSAVFLHFAALNTEFQLKLHPIKSQWAVVTLLQALDLTAHKIIY